MTHDGSGDVHLRYCANRNIAVSLTFVAFCMMGVLLSWRSLSKELSEHRAILLLGDAGGIVLLAQWFAVFRCLRERVVLSLGIVRLAIGLIAGLAPALVSPAAVLVRDGSLALWVFAAALSFSMLVSAARRPKPA